MFMQHDYEVDKAMAEYDEDVALLPDDPPEANSDDMCYHFIPSQRGRVQRSRRSFW